MPVHAVTVILLILLSCLTCLSSASFAPTARLPPLLQFVNGTSVKTTAQWVARKAEIRNLFIANFIGTFPNEVPKITSIATISSIPFRGGTSKTIQLSFDTHNNASFTMEVMMPDGDGPFPVFMTQTTHRRWALVAFSRGYIGVVYPGADNDDQTDVFQKAYPLATWGTISRRAWLGMRALDYILTLPQTDKTSVGITGHSRNGKQSVIATALDERITAVVSSSAGVPASSAYRFSGRTHFSEAPSDFLDHWFLESLRDFTGRENELPIDANGWLGLISPRHCLLADAYNDHEGDTTFAVEKNYLSGQNAYRFQNAEDNLRILWRRGDHHGFIDADDYIDWFDLAFKRNPLITIDDFPEILLHHFDWPTWSKTQKETKPPSGSSKKEIIQWFLGKEPPMGLTPGGTYTAEWPYVTSLLRRDSGVSSDVERVGVNFGNYLTGHIYFKKGVQTPMPAVIFAHPHSYFDGFVQDYGINAERISPIYVQLAQQGYFVFTFDQLGYGVRLLQDKKFYKRFPNFSKMGRGVFDVIQALDFIHKGNGYFPKGGFDPIVRPVVDTSKVSCIGYDVGGSICLYSAAFDKRINAVGSIAGFAPLRTDSYESTGGIERLWSWYAMMPRLGFYKDNQKAIPYDFDDVLEMIAPISTLVYAPMNDIGANVTDVLDITKVAQEAWHKLNADGNFTVMTPNDYSRLQKNQITDIITWLKKIW